MDSSLLRALSSGHIGHISACLCSAWAAMTDRRRRQRLLVATLPPARRDDASRQKSLEETVPSGSAGPDNALAP